MTEPRAPQEPQEGSAGRNSQSPANGPSNGGSGRSGAQGGSRAPWVGVVIAPNLDRARIGPDPGATFGRFVLRTAATALALWVATALLGGIAVSGSTHLRNALTLVGVALIFGLINAAIKPIIQVLGCFFYVVTFGLIAFVVNALLFLATSWLAGELGLPFHVQGFWTAFWGAIIVGVVTWVIGLAVPGARHRD